MYRRRRFRSRSTRRFRRPRTRFQKSRRLFRRFIRRRAVRPELKHNDKTINMPAISGGTNYTNAMTVVSLNQGTNYDQRVGNQVNFIKVDARMNFRNDSATTLPAQAPAVPSSLVRVIVWSPRVDYSTALSYMNNLSTTSLLDPLYATYHRDMTFSLSPPYMSEATSNDIAGGPSLYSIIKTMSIRFPRKVKFAPSSVNVDEEKYSLYFTIVNGQLNLIGFFNFRTWYFDS